MEQMKEKRKAYNVYLDIETRKQMQLNEILTGIKFQDKIRDFIKKELQNEKN